MKEEELRRFNEADWGTITPRLIDYAFQKVRRLRWKTGKFLPKGFTPEDLALGAIRKTLDGIVSEPSDKRTRRWDCQTDPDLLLFLKGVVDSDVSALVRSFEHKTVNYRGDTKAEEAEKRNLHEMETEQSSSSSDNPESLMAEKERAAETKARFSRLLEMLFDECGDDEEVKLLLLAYQEVAEKDEKVRPAAVAASVGLDASRFSAAKKRLDRKIAAVEKRLLKAEKALRMYDEAKR